ncbi:MAG: CAP domain-containing protein [Ilumatobacteraceae bacterium]
MTYADVPQNRRRHRRRHIVRTAVVGAIAIGSGMVATGYATTAAAGAGDSWLDVVNTYRSMSGLAPVSSNATWSAEAEAHSCYMLQNGIAHDEIPGLPGYTPGGDVAGNSGNVAVSSSIGASARNHIDLWMTGPFHAIGILRSNLTSTGFGLCTSSTTPTWHSGGTLDVIRGLDAGRPRPTSPIVFPGNGATVPLHSFVTEFPNPMTLCNWTGSAGLPLIAMMPGDVTSAEATLTGPNGPIPTCILHEGNTGGDSTARAILGGDNAIIVMPRDPLADGLHTVTVNSSGGNVSWSFTVDRNAPLAATPQPPPDMPDTTATAGRSTFEPVTPFRLVDSRTSTGAVRLAAGAITRVAVGTSDIVAVSANFAAVAPAANGFITAYNCTTELPTVSTLGYEPSQTVANQAIVPLQDGDLCLFSLVDTDVIVDVNGYYRSGKSGSGFTPLTPKRIHDSREPGSTRLRAGEERAIAITGSDGGAPAGANGAALNVTVVTPSGHGFLQVYPCGAPVGAAFSNVNYVPDEIRPNSVVSLLDDSGRVCVRSLTDADVLVDLTGYFKAGAGLNFLPLSPIRLFDSRSSFAGLNPVTGGDRVGAGQVVHLKIAGQRGIPTNAKAVSVNITATEAVAPTFLTAFPCGSMPDTSNINLVPRQAVNANGAMVKLSGDGELCVYTLQGVHVIVDINGVWN